MLRFLFWNLGRRSPLRSLDQLMVDLEPHFVLLAESPISAVEFLGRFNQSPARSYHSLPCGGARLQLYSVFGPQFVKRLRSVRSASTKWAFWRVELPARQHFLLAGVHLISSREYSDSAQAHETRLLAASLQFEERRVGHSRTVIVGDFNQDPFNRAMVEAGGLHAVMTRKLAERGSRVVQGREYPFFYNPMWGCFGDRTAGPAGTYYHETSDHLAYFWHVRDQILLRPDLIPAFAHEGLRILDTDGEVSLTRRDGRPDRHHSDHLPITFALDP